MRRWALALRGPRCAASRWKVVPLSALTRCACRPAQVQVVCGSGHTVVLTEAGEVYTWGRGDDGRLGHGDNGWKYVPRLVDAIKDHKVTQVTCGSYHTAAVTQLGELFSWPVCSKTAAARNAYFVLSTSKSREKGAQGRKKRKLEKLVLEVHGCARALAKFNPTMHGPYAGWGGGMYGKLGHGNESGHSTPCRVEALRGKRVEQASDGS